MFCAHCGTENATGTDLCDRCGEPLIVPDDDQAGPLGVKTCPGCGAHNESHARFCIGCGEGLDDVPALALQDSASAYSRPAGGDSSSVIPPEASTSPDARQAPPQAAAPSGSSETARQNGPTPSPEIGAPETPAPEPAKSRPPEPVETPAGDGTRRHGELQVSELATRIREAVQRVIVGKDEAINLAIVALLCRGHLLIEDVPGLGKTTLAKSLADSLRCDFGRIQFTPDLMPADVLGVSIFNMRDNEFEFRKGPVFTQVLLADEINRATPRTQTALLEAMQERQVTMDGETRPLPDPFLVMATLNPVELEGTFPLPEAQLDRFMLRISLGYPDHDEETRIIERFTAGGKGPETPAVVSREELLAAQGSISDVTVEPSLRDYLLSIVAATREHEALHLGASPRAAIALYHAAQAWAAIQGRDYVLPDDIKRVAVPVLAHRVMISPQAGLRGRAGDNVILELLETIEVPIER